MITEDQLEQLAIQWQSPHPNPLPRREGGSRNIKHP